MEKSNILVVDDDQMNRIAAEKMFGDHNLYIAADFYDAIINIEKTRFDVLLTDLWMPYGEMNMSCDYSSQPLGYTIAFYAARPHITIPRIAIVSDSLSRDDAMISSWGTMRTQFALNLHRKDQEIKPERSVGKKQCLILMIPIC